VDDSPLARIALTYFLGFEDSCQFTEEFIVDFYGHPVKITRGLHKSVLVIKADGDIHDLQQEEDARREKVLRELGLRIVRFRNDEVMRNLSIVVERIKGIVEKSKEQLMASRSLLCS
jgi:very-short-patch-repair endonuclease